MSDGMPSEEQLARIRRGVMHRIDLRRLVARRIAGGAAAVLIVGGGIGLLATTHFPASGGSSGSAAGGSMPEAASAAVAVRCAIHPGDESASRATVHVPADRLPEAAIAACTGATDFQSASGAVPSATTDARGSAVAYSLCVDVDGTYVVLPRHGTAQRTCVASGMEPYAR